MSPAAITAQKIWSHLIIDYQKDSSNLNNNKLMNYMNFRSHFVHEEYRNYYRKIPFLMMLKNG